MTLIGGHEDGDRADVSKVQNEYMKHDLLSISIPCGLVVPLRKDCTLPAPSTVVANESAPPIIPYLCRAFVSHRSEDDTGSSTTIAMVFTCPKVRHFSIEEGAAM